MLVAFNFGEEGFCRPEVEVQVETDGEVVTVVGYVEGDDLFILVLFVVLYQ